MCRAPREYDSRVIFIDFKPVTIQLFSPAVLLLSTACQAQSVLAGGVSRVWSFVDVVALDRLTSTVAYRKQ